MKIFTLVNPVTQEERIVVADNLGQACSMIGWLPSRVEVLEVNLQDEAL